MNVKQKFTLCIGLRFTNARFDRLCKYRLTEEKSCDAGLTDIIITITIISQLLDLFAWCVRLSRLLVGFRTHLKSMHFQFQYSIIA